MRVIIAGGREFADLAQVTYECNRLLMDHEPFDNLSIYSELIVVSGGARGADQLGEKWAVANGFPIERYPADWDTYGKRAGVMRNMTMADNADMLIAFWDGTSRGTKHMIDVALTADLEVHVLRYENV